MIGLELPCWLKERTHQQYSLLETGKTVFTKNHQVWQFTSRNRKSSMCYERAPSWNTTERLNEH